MGRARLHALLLAVAETAARVRRNARCNRRLTAALPYTVGVNRPSDSQAV
jgi:hypothetical protein